MVASTTISPIPAEYAIEPKLDRRRVIVHIRDSVRVFKRPRPRRDTDDHRSQLSH
jgi:ATP-dependent DNA ligase